MNDRSVPAPWQMKEQFNTVATFTNGVFPPPEQAGPQSEFILFIPSWLEGAFRGGQPMIPGHSQRSRISG